MRRKPETYRFLGEPYALSRIMDDYDGDGWRPLCVTELGNGEFVACTTMGFDADQDNLLADLEGRGRGRLSAIRDLERKCIRRLRALAKLCGCTVIR